MSIYNVFCPLQFEFFRQKNISFGDLGEFGLQLGPIKSKIDHIWVSVMLKTHNRLVRYLLVTELFNLLIRKRQTAVCSERKWGVKLILPYPVQPMEFEHVLIPLVIQ